MHSFDTGLINTSKWEVTQCIIFIKKNVKSNNNEIHEWYHPQICLSSRDRYSVKQKYDFWNSVRSRYLLKLAKRPKTVVIMRLETTRVF